MEFWAISAVAFGLAAGISVFFRPSGRASALGTKSLEKKHVVITGGSSGIGFAMAQEVILQGGFVTLISRSYANLQAAVERLVKDLSCDPDRVLSKVADVSDHQAITQAIQEAFQWKPIDFLICNAGLTRGGQLENQPVEDMDLVIRTNLNGTVYPVHAALPLMKERSKEHPGSIVFIGSQASLFVFYGHSVYTATKYAVKGLAESLKLELTPYDISVSLACPGFVDTPFLDEAEKEKDEDDIKLLKIVNLYDRKNVEIPKNVAKKVLEGAKQGTFLITTNIYPGLFVSTLARGFLPAESVGRCLLEMIMYFPFRALSLLGANDIHKAILKYSKVNIMKM
uniref:Uncharacterized protein n=1 Tax=Picea sitchensis TaxID=3332 RepID=A9NZ20_PICSI|nr:unknown [Picea sitchensis]